MLNAAHDSMYEAGTSRTENYLTSDRAKLFHPQLLPMNSAVGLGSLLVQETLQLGLVAHGSPKLVASKL